MASMSIRGRREIGSVAAALVILAVVAFVVLYIAVLAPKPPQVVAMPVAIRRFQFTDVPIPMLNLTLWIGVHVRNPNYASVKYPATAALVYYHGYLVGEAPIPSGSIDARSDEDVDTVVDVFVDRVVSNGYFDRDVAAGFLNLTAIATVLGKGTVAGFIKTEVISHTTCNTMVILIEAATTSSCSSTVEISP